MSKELDKAYMAGVRDGCARLGMRMEKFAATPGARHRTANIIAEYLSPYTSTAVGAGFGGLIGAGLEYAHGGAKPDIMRGARRGAQVAGGLSAVRSAIHAPIAAAIRRRRTREEQAEHDDSVANAIVSMLVPGEGTYNTFKRFGSNRDPDDHSRDRKAKKYEKDRKD